MRLGHALPARNVRLSAERPGTAGHHEIDAPLRQFERCQRNTISSVSPRAKGAVGKTLPPRAEAPAAGDDPADDGQADINEERQ